jgi:hypothetical protein
MSYHHIRTPLLWELLTASSAPTPLTATAAKESSLSGQQSSVEGTAERTDRLAGDTAL